MRSCYTVLFRYESTCVHYRHHHSRPNPVVRCQQQCNFPPIIFFLIFWTHHWLNARMENLQIQKANCTLMLVTLMKCLQSQTLRKGVSLVQATAVRKIEHICTRAGNRNKGPELRLNFKNFGSTSRSVCGSSELAVSHQELVSLYIKQSKTARRRWLQL